MTKSDQILGGDTDPIENEFSPAEQKLMDEFDRQFSNAGTKRTDFINDIRERCSPEQIAGFSEFDCIHEPQYFMGIISRPGTEFSDLREVLE